MEQENKGLGIPMRRSVLQAVFFDIDDTLYSTTRFAEKARRASIAAMIRGGLRADPRRCYAELLEVISEFSSNYEHHYDKLLLRLPKDAWTGINPAVLISAAIVAYHGTKFRELHPYKDVLAALRLLSSRGLLLGVISAGLSVKQAEKLVRLGVIRYLDPRAIFISEQIGISKPNPKLYLMACRRLNLSPAEVIYVGDDPVMDIDPPNRVGIRTVRCRRGGRHDREQGLTEPTHEIRSLRDLCRIVRAEYVISRRKP